MPPEVAGPGARQRLVCHIWRQRTTVHYSTSRLRGLETPFVARRSTFTPVIGRSSTPFSLDGRDHGNSTRSETEQTSRRRSAIVGALAVAIGGLLVAETPALAVHDIDFQLDGDVVSTPDTNVGGTTQEFDWADFFSAAGAVVDPLPAGFDAAAHFVANSRSTRTAPTTSQTPARGRRVARTTWRSPPDGSPTATRTCSTRDDS